MSYGLIWTLSSLIGTDQIAYRRIASGAIQLTRIVPKIFFRMTTPIMMAVMTLTTVQCPKNW